MIQSIKKSKEIESLENYFDVSYNEKQILAIKNAYEKISV